MPMLFYSIRISVYIYICISMYATMRHLPLTQRESHRGCSHEP